MVVIEMQSVKEEDYGWLPPPRKKNCLNSPSLGNNKKKKKEYKR